MINKCINCGYFLNCKYASENITDCDKFVKAHRIITKKRRKREMQIKLNGTKSDISAMLISTVRYALGRRTYIVNWTCEFIANNQHLLLEKDKKVIIRDIKEQTERGYGDKCDEEDWLKLLELLEKG